MKKHLEKVLLAAFAVMLLSMSVLVGCGGGGTPESLDGTKWELSKVSGNGIEMDAKQAAMMLATGDSDAAANMNFEFKDGKVYVFGETDGKDYTYENGKITLDGQQGTVNGNSMTFDINENGVTLTMTFDKK